MPAKIVKAVFTTVEVLCSSCRPVLARERYEIVVLTIVETCEARVGLFMSQERSGKCFSPLWSFCEVRAGLFKCQETSRKLI